MTTPVLLSLLSPCPSCPSCPLVPPIPPVPLSPFSYNHSPSPVAGKCHHLTPLSPGQRANDFGGTGPGDTICDQVTLSVTR